MASTARATDIGTQVGYQLTVGRTAQMQVCPVASLSLGMGPNDVDGGGIDAVRASAGQHRLRVW